MATSETVQHIFGQKDVTSAGTAVQISSDSRSIVGLLIIAHDNNTGRIFYGDSDVASTTQRGLAPGESVSIPAPMRGVSIAAFDIGDIYVDAETNDDGIDFVAAKAL